MKTTIVFLPLATFSLVFLNSCKNPADETTDAQVGETAPAATSSGGVKYTFTDSSTIGFIGSKISGSHDGGFRKFEGHFFVEEGTPKSGEFEIDMNSTWSDNEKLTEHLKNPDFFNVATYPTSTFVVTDFEKKSDSAYQLSGNFTLHGVTKNISFPVAVESTDDKVNLTAEFDIDRTLFGITYDGAKDDLIRKEVVIKLDLEAVPES